MLYARQRELRALKPLQALYNARRDPRASLAMGERSC